MLANSNIHCPAAVGYGEVRPAGVEIPTSETCLGWQMSQPVTARMEVACHVITRGVAYYG